MSQAYYVLTELSKKTVVLPYTHTDQRPSQTLCLSLSETILIGDAPILLSRDSPYDYTLEARLPVPIPEGTKALTWRQDERHILQVRDIETVGPLGRELMCSHLVVPAEAGTYDVSDETQVIMTWVVTIADPPEESRPFKFYERATQQECYRDRIFPILDSVVPSEFLGHQALFWDQWVLAFRPLLIETQPVDIYTHLTAVARTQEEEALYLISLMVLKALEDYPALTAVVTKGSVLTIVDPAPIVVETANSYLESNDPTTVWTSDPLTLPGPAVICLLVDRWAMNVRSDERVDVPVPGLVPASSLVKLEYPIWLLRSWSGRLPRFLVETGSTRQLLALAVTEHNGLDATGVLAGVWRVTEFRPRSPTVRGYDDVWEIIDSSVEFERLTLLEPDTTRYPNIRGPTIGPYLALSRPTQRNTPIDKDLTEYARTTGYARLPWILRRNGTLLPEKKVLWVADRVVVAQEIDLEPNTPMAERTAQVEFKDDWLQPVIDFLGPPGPVKELVVVLNGKHYRAEPPVIVRDTTTFLDRFPAMIDGVITKVQRWSTEGEWVWPVEESTPIPPSGAVVLPLDPNIPVVAVGSAWRHRWSPEGHLFIRTADPIATPLEIKTDDPALPDRFSFEVEGEVDVEELTVWIEDPRTWTRRTYYCRPLGERQHDAIRLPEETTTVVKLTQFQLRTIPVL